MVADRNEDLDVIGLADDELEAAVQVFYVRRGRVVGRKGFVLDKVEDVSPDELVGRILERLYAEPPPLGVPEAGAGARTSPTSSTLYAELAHRAAGLGGVDPGAPAGRQAVAAGDGHAERQGGVHPPPAEAGQRPQQPGPGAQRAAGAARPARGPAAHRVLRHEPHPGHRLRGLDGRVRGRPAQEVRVPAVQDCVGVEGNDDFAAMEEVLTRRLGNYLAERGKPVSEREGRFAYPPQLLLVDGGKGQLSVAVRVLSRSWASTRRSPWPRWPSGSRRSSCRARPTRSDLPRQSEALYLLQRIRDEAHRFAIDYHRELRGKRMTTHSVLDDVPGLGPTRKKRLVKELGGVKAVKDATVDELQALPWLPDTVAEAVYKKHPRPDRPVGFGARPSVERRALGDPRRLVAGGLHRRRRPRVRRADPAAGGRAPGRGALGARRGHGRGPGGPAGPRPRSRDGSSASTPRGRRSTRRSAGAGDRPTSGRGAAALPFADGTFDAVVACLVFEHIEDVDAAIAEVARVLGPGGRFLFFLNHPLLQTPAAGGSTTRCSTRRSSTGGSGPTSWRTRRSRRWRRTSSSRSSTAR